MEQEYVVVNYYLESRGGINYLRETYPHLSFRVVVDGIYSIFIPDSEVARDEFTQLRIDIDFVEVPTLYGLNASNAYDASNISIFHDYPYGSLRGNGIIVGFVDTGIDYNNVYFKNADNTTRIIGIWDQTIDGDNAPQPYDYGTVYTREQINEALASENPYEIVPSVDTVGHGTFLAGVAAGNDQSEDASFVGGAPNADILVVKMKQASAHLRNEYLIDDTVNAYQENDLLSGIDYLIKTAAELNQPLVICIGVGNNLGAHNGSDVIENYIEYITLLANTIFVIASGNEATRGHHYYSHVAQGGTQDIEVNVADNEAGMILNLWTEIDNKVTVSIRSPLGQTIEKVPIKYLEEQRFKFNLEQTQLSVTYTYPDILSGGEKVLLRFTDPTPGIWTITVYGEKVNDGAFHLWLPMRGFIDDGTIFLRPDSETTVQIPGTIQYGVIVGAYDYLDDSIYVASGRGPTSNLFFAPDIIAPGVNVVGPAVGGGLTSFVGTSTAAAVTTAACALLLEWAVIEKNLPRMNTRIAKGMLIRGARQQNGVDYPNNTEGYGRLDLQGAIANV